jgi:GDPmannose 4,6-dehydratase
MLQQDSPDDYVISSDETHSVRQFCEIAFNHVGLSWKDHVVVDERYFRPAEVDLLIGCSAKARSVLRWKPRIDFEGLVRMMVEADVAACSQDGAHPSRPNPLN